jgi:cyclophilin family peptidyl-prolyl cis-trans isomerase
VSFVRRIAAHAVRAPRAGSCLALALALVSCAGVKPNAAPARVALDTSMGRIVVELDAARAPISTQNFLRYVSEGHYDGTLVHRVVEDFVIQGGGLDAVMNERPTHPAIVNEAKNGLSNRAGTLAMARDFASIRAIDSATAQWFINVVDNPRLDHVDVPPEGVTVTRGGKDVLVMPAEADRVFGYAVFGRVVDGMDAVERMRHVPVHTVGRGEDMRQNVSVDPIIIEKAAQLPTT